MPEPDHLSNEVSAELSISEKVDGIAISAKAKSRAGSALDRLVGGIFDLPAAYLDGKAERVRARDAVEVALIKEEGKAAIAALYRDPDFGARTAERFAQDQARKQINREAVAAKTIEHLQETQDAEDLEGEIDDDWHSVFEAGAEKANSDRLRDFWARVLAGEVRKPGSFCLSTLRFISELDATIAETFQRNIDHRLPPGMIICPKKLKGVPLQELSFLEAVGLLQGLHGTVGRDLTVDDNGVIHYIVDDLILTMKVEKKKKLRLNIIYITRIGMEIISILPAVTAMDSLEAIAAHFDGEIQSATINHIISREDGGVVRFRPIKPLKVETPP